MLLLQIVNWKCKLQNKSETVASSLYNAHTITLLGFNLDAPVADCGG